MKRTLAGLLALVFGLNGLVMIFAGLWWYGVVPGVVATGPYNPHFVKDIGSIYLVCAAALAWRAARPLAGQGALVAAAAFQVLHALVHVTDAAVCGSPVAALVRDTPAIFLPTLITVWLAWPARKS
ncbi:hypothetical protein ACO2Q3_03315 [Caulobacter sp. KR2-114]|uniref:hypothetical protein n=1 Tax=Caulobacter sp. KR2-114 TaxID=3400912 RepID=UPI003BFDB079